MKTIKLFGLLAIMAISSFLFVSNTTSSNPDEYASIVLNAYDAPKADSTHVCNSDCKPGSHNFKHGEKGHKCSVECQKAGKNNADLSKHECSSKCKDGKHSYSHGEEGHKCTSKCKRSKPGCCIHL